MSLQIYNTLTRQKESFQSLNPGRVSMYVCGPTVYGYLHVGNFRGAVFFNFVRNWLQHLGYEVQYVYNFTDVDDKIIAQAAKENVSCDQISEKYIRAFYQDYQDLKLSPHTNNPRVTEYIPEIIQMVQSLIQNGKAYVTEDGEVLYSVRSFEGYGKLSGRQIDELQSGARVEVDAKKRDPLDFALWKPAKPAEPSWPSPWGAGRPGWHIECSAMAKTLIGDQVDIHGGGSDLIFPHHENEVAQSEGCTGKHFVKYWMHTNMFTFGGQKMSKSLGNLLYAHEFLKQYPAEVYKYMVLSVHYRTAAEFSDKTADLAIKGLARIYSALALVESFKDESGSAAVDATTETQLNQAWESISDSVNDDFATPQVFATLFEVVRGLNQQFRRGMKMNATVSAKAHSYLRWFQRVGSLLALFQEPPREFLHQLDDMLLVQMNLQRSEVDALVQERVEARMAKDFAKSDELRDQLTKMGIQVADTSEGSHWEVMKGV